MRSGRPEHGIVRRLQPDLAAALRQATELAGHEFAAAQSLPENAVRGRVCNVRRHEHAVMPADERFGSIAYGGGEIGVRGENGAIEIELDHRLRTVERRDLAGIIGTRPLQVGDVGIAGRLQARFRMDAGANDAVAGRNLTRDRDHPALLETVEQEVLADMAVDEQAANARPVGDGLRPIDAVFRTPAEHR